MTTGYLVASGRGPYSPLDLGGVFHHAGFEQLTTIGYPPPWPLVTGLLYRATYGLLPDLHLYDLALKLPVIAATVGLAYLVAAALRQAGARDDTCRKAWIFLLFNPFVLLCGAAWGQIDVIVALLAVGALVLVWRGRWASSAARCCSPGRLHQADAAAHRARRAGVAAGRAPREAVRYAAVFLAWAACPGGGPVRDARLADGARVQRTAPERPVPHDRRPLVYDGRPAGPGLVGAARPLVAPGHAVGDIGLAAGPVLWARRGLRRPRPGAAALTLVFLLTRAWLAEPNVVLLLPRCSCSLSLGHLDRRLLHGPLVLPLASTVLTSRR